ncbi:MAG: hypothetical protein LBH44_05840 [Treponema sp.]|jgi:hypothetical protein|nr:hypothetical protein [Treponema sp.]
MYIEQMVVIPADRRLHLDFDLPFEIPMGKARAALTLTLEKEQEHPAADKWVNPLLGLANAKGSTLTLERFMEMQREDIELENENDRRLWSSK